MTFQFFKDNGQTALDVQSAAKGGGMKHVNYKLVAHHAGTVIGYIIGTLVAVAAVLAAVKLVLLAARWLFG